MTIETREVLAAAYLGPNKQTCRRLSHACEIGAEGEVTRVLCGRVSELAMSASTERWSPNAEPTCERCQRIVAAAREKARAAAVRLNDALPERRVEHPEGTRVMLQVTEHDAKQLMVGVVTESVRDQARAAVFWEWDMSTDPPRRLYTDGRTE